MLAQTYLDARKLGITERERDALIDVLAGLERGHFVHLQDAEVANNYAVGLAFNMSDFNCGTTACIAGWCDLLHGTQFVKRCAGSWTNRPGRRRNLQDLFHAEDDDYSADDNEWIYLEEITTAQAAAALRNYLTSGKARWGEVMGGDD
jgi:hypothetical protein